MGVDSLLHRRRTSRLALVARRMLGHAVSGLAVGVLLSFPLGILPEFRLNFAAGCCLLMLLMIAIDLLLSIRIRRRTERIHHPSSGSGSSK